MTALLAAIFLLLQLLRVLVPVECSCRLPDGYIEYPEDNTAYKIHGDYIKWDEGRARCIAEGADLAVATSPQKIKHITRNEIFSRIWANTGVRRPTNSSDWVRVDNGQPVTSIPWTNFSPDYEDRNCAIIYPNNGGSITNDYCDVKYAFVCEISLAEGCPDPVGPQGLKGDNTTST